MITSSELLMLKKSHQGLRWRPPVSSSSWWRHVVFFAMMEPIWKSHCTTVRVFEQFWGFSSMDVPKTVESMGIGRSTKIYQETTPNTKSTDELKMTNRGARNEFVIDNRRWQLKYFWEMFTPKIGSSFAPIWLPQFFKWVGSTTPFFQKPVIGETPKVNQWIAVYRVYYIPYIYIPQWWRLDIGKCSSATICWFH